MELSYLIKDFVSRRENGDVLVELTKLSTEYYSDFVHRRYFTVPKQDVDYNHTLKKINDYIKKHKEFKRVDPKDFSVELMKYLYEHRVRLGRR